MIIGLLLLTLQSDFGERQDAFVAGGLALGGFLLSMLMLTVGIDNLISRNLLALWLPAALVLAAPMGARRAGLAFRTCRRSVALRDRDCRDAGRSG